MPTLTGIFSILIAASGWFYLFFSTAAQKLASLEQAAINARRIRLRRVGGVMLILLGMLLYTGSDVVSWETPTIWFVITWLGVMVLLAAVTILALLDLRLTQQLRQCRMREVN